MTAATKKEALDALNTARTKAQFAAERLGEQYGSAQQAPNPDLDAAKLHYQRCVSEFEQAINAFAPYETSGDD